MNKKFIKLCIISTSFIMSACVSYTPYKQPQELTMQSKLEQESVNQWSQFAKDKWWQTFDDDALNQMVERALESNFSLQAAWERLQASRALSHRVGSNRFPTLTATIGDDRTRSDGVSNKSYSAGLTSSYEVDIWGSKSAELHAQIYRTEAIEQSYFAAVLSLTSDISNLWMELSEAQLQKKLLQRQLGTSLNTLKVLSIRFDLGQAQSEDVLRQELTVESVRSELLVLEKNTQLLKNQMAVLLAEPITEANYTASSNLPVLTRLPETAIPLSLLQRRPDVQQSYLELLATDRDLAVAIKAQYPSLDLTASLRSTNQNLGDLFSNWLSSLALNLTAPIFDGGNRRAEVERQMALRNAQLANYRHVSLTAIQEVESALLQEQQQRALLDSLEYRLDLARKAYERIEVRYLNGGTEFLTLLSAQNQQQSLERNVLTARKNLVTYRIALFKALAGKI